MEKNHRSHTDSRSPSQKTDQVREFLTAFLATLAVAVVAFGLTEKLTENAESGSFSMKEGSLTTTEAKSILREFSQEVEDGDETKYSGLSAPDQGTTPVEVVDLGNTPVTKTGEADSPYASLIAQLNSGQTPPPELYIAASNELLARGAGADAKTIIQSGLIAHPDNTMVALGSADVRAATGDAEAAWKELAQTGNTTNADVMSRLIKYATVAGKVDETMTILGDLELLPWTPSAEDWSNLVSMLTDAGRFDEAKTAVDLSPEKKVLKKKLEAVEKIEKGEYDKALEKITEYIDKTKNVTPEDWALLAEIYTGLGDTAKANDAYREAEGLKQQQAGGGGFWDFLAGMFGGG
ncbi:MAG: hypothetical protein P1U86_13100 [Verrucomicrobiales bacterium]|nr:hypothetical protein [Verrucomicrobiales bacterium]